MPTPTYDLIASNVLSSSASSVTFSSIPATYRDLVLVIEATRLSGTDFAYLRFNGDTGANYSNVAMTGDGSTDYSQSGSGSDQGRFAILGNTSKNLAIISIMDYSATDKHKTFLTRSNDGATANGVWAFVSRWANTAAINSIVIDEGTSSFTSGSTFYLYGIVS